MVQDILKPDAATGQTQTQLATPPRYGSKRDVAAMLQVSVRTVDNLIGKQGCPFLRLGRRRVRFDMAEVRQWLSETYRTQQRRAVKGGAS